MLSTTSLSLNDNAVLGALFDPEASLDHGSICIQPAPTAIIDSIPKHFRQFEEDAVKLLNVVQPDVEQVVSAIGTLSTIIDVYPRYAPAYVNRAQARRLLPESLDQAMTVREIFSDLDTAISIAKPVLEYSVTSDDARLLSSAYTHRGSLLMRASIYPEFREILVKLQLPSLRSIVDASQFENLASKDFGIAGRFGNKTAQQLAVKTNPYAKLCGQIVKEALQREIKEYYEVDQVH